MHQLIFELVVELLAQKLQFIKMCPDKIGIIGSDYGNTAKMLKSLYAADLIELDFDQEKYYPVRNNGYLSRLKKPINTFKILEFQNVGSYQFDFIISNLFLVRFLNRNQLFKFWRNALKENGMLFFSFLGLSSFKEIYTRFERDIREEIPPYQMDMHDVGDELILEGFSEPVMSMDHYILTYHSVDTLIQDLEVLEVLPSMLTWLNMGKLKFKQELQVRGLKDNIFHVSYEFIFAHAINKVIAQTCSSDEKQIQFFKK